MQAEIGVGISGDGGLVKTDTGTLTLSGNNTYLGGTTIRTGTLSVAVDANLGAASGGLAFDGGTLQNTADFTSARIVDLGADGGTFQADADLTLDGVVSGAGRLTKTGTGTLTLSGNNSYAGGTQVRAGTLVGDSTAIRGDLANNGHVVFDQAGDGSFTGTLSGSGTMSKRGAGALTLTGSSALDWSIDAGALVSRSDLFGGDADIGAGGRLRFQQEGGGNYAGTLGGNGRFEIASGALFALTGDSAAFGGTTVVENGTLRIDGTLGGGAIIASGATLTGAGTLGSVDNAGTVAAGNSIGTLTLTGDYLHRDGATLLAEIEPGGNGDLLDVAGTATITGGDVQIVKLPGQYADGTRYTLIDAAGGISGSFSALGQDLPFLNLSLAYDANHAYLDIARSDIEFGEICVTVNQCQVAVTIDDISGGGALPPDLATVVNELTTVGIDSALSGFNSLSGEAHASFAGMMLEGHALYGQTVSRRLAERREAVGAQQLQGGVWARAYGMASELDGDGNAHGADVDLHGAAFGIDAWGTEHWLIGASFNAMRVDADFRPGDGGEADAKNIALYTSVQGERAYLDGVISFAWWDSEVQRRIEVGSIHRQARSEYDSNRLALYLEGGWNIDLGGSRLQPLVSVEHSQLDTQNFHESGAQDLDLIGRSQSATRTTASAGLRWTGWFARGGWTLEPSAQLRWLHSTGDLNAEFEIAFAGAPDTGYRVRGGSWPEDRGLVGVGFNARRGDKLDLFVDYDYQRGGGLEAHNLSAGLRYRW
ncbi:autotransporter outer membrane beta-barrel domain-containing protein [Luteimonas salinilitoris]|uniref:Autotransporter domain-containing protein n=1 Tax=Luteimonas salinilitoris TaxID=3237697 RepID=A0ABV4HVS8_9GAMM